MLLRMSMCKSRLLGCGRSAQVCSRVRGRFRRDGTSSIMWSGLKQGIKRLSKLMSERRCHHLALHCHHRRSVVRGSINAFHGARWKGGALVAVGPVSTVGPRYETVGLVQDFPDAVEQSSTVLDPPMPSYDSLF
jgi:hypothetical protein